MSDKRVPVGMRSPKVPSNPPTLEMEKVEKVDSLPQMDTLEVTLDTPWETIVDCDGKGIKVNFADEPGKFKRLSGEQLDQLHRLTQASYLVSERYHQSALDNASNPKALLKDIRQSSRATDRLFVGNKSPDKAYSWKRPDELRRAVGYEGWKVEQDPKLETFRKPTGGSYTVGALGEDELLLVSRPKNLHEAHLREAMEKSESRRGSIEKQAAGERGYFGEGDPRFDPKGKAWKDVDPSQE